MPVTRKRFGALSMLAGMALVLALVGMLGVSREARAQSDTTVTIADFAFSPNAITVQAGSTVTWVNNDAVPHTATGDNGEFDTGSIAPGGSATITFDTAGTIAYHCTIHPNMTASITVQAASNGNTGNNSGQTGQLPNTGSGVGGSTSSLVAYAVLASLVLAIGGFAVRRRMA
jgi:plastocyanin